MLNADYLKTAGRYIVAFILGFICCYIFYPRTTTVTQYLDQSIQGKAQAVTKTEIVYIPKETIRNSDGRLSKEKTDIELKLAKQELNVKINDKDAIINKADDEQYIFEKNKISLQQTSTAEINIKVPVVNNTKYWELGFGYGSNGIAGKIGFPINKESGVGGWIYSDKKTGAVGINIKF